MTETQKIELAEITKKLYKVEQELTKRELSIIDEEMRIKKQFEQQMCCAKQHAEVKSRIGEGMNFPSINIRL